MAKPKVLRSAEAHKVKVEEGSNIAQQKSAPKTGKKEEAPASPPIIRKPVTPSNVRAVARITPGLSPLPDAGRASSAKEPSFQGSPGVKFMQNATAQPTYPAPATADSLWEPDEVVLQRIHDLRDLNAQLAEQIERLSKPAPEGTRR